MVVEYNYLLEKAKEVEKKIHEKTLSPSEKMRLVSDIVGLWRNEFYTSAVALTKLKEVI